jgi:hypothetical protein
MNTTEIRRILHTAINKQMTTDVFACDQLQSLKSEKFAVIVNSDTSDEPGTHWLALFKESGDTVEFFDSYAMPIEFYNTNILNFVSTKCKFLRQSEIQIQSDFSSVCGQFCIFYLVSRANGLNFNDILNEFSEINLSKNNEKVSRFVRDNFGLDSSTACANERNIFLQDLIVQCSKIFIKSLV